MDNRYSEPGDLDDSDDDNEDDPWKPLNLHEPGNFTVNPFKKVKSFRRQVKWIPITMQFPLAKMHDAISSELTEVWKAHLTMEREEFQSPPLCEKLRNSLVHREHDSCDTVCDSKDDKEEDEYDNEGLDFSAPDSEMPENLYWREKVPLHPEKV